MLPLAHAKVLAGSHFDNPCNTEDIFPVLQLRLYHPDPSVYREEA